MAETHDLSFEYSGQQSRVICTCGWKAEWRWTGRRDIQRALHSDENQHHYMTKRAEEAEK